MELAQFTEKQLIEDAKTGDKEAFGRLYDRYYLKIFKYLSLRLPNKEDAEDLAENVFIKAWTHLPHFRKQRNGYQFQAWLFKIAHNSLVDKYRKKEIQVQALDLLSQDNGQILPEHSFEKAEQSQELFSAINTLDKDSRNVIILRFIIGLSHQEIRDVLGKTSGNIRVIQHRALKKLKGLIKRKCN